MTLNTIARMFANSCSRSRAHKECLPGNIDGWVKRDRKRRAGCTGCYQVVFGPRFYDHQQRIRCIRLEPNHLYVCLNEELAPDVVFKFNKYTLEHSDSRMRGSRYERTRQPRWMINITYLASTTHKSGQPIDTVEMGPDIIQPIDDLMLFLYLPHKYPDFEKELFNQPIRRAAHEEEEEAPARLRWSPQRH